MASITYASQALIGLLGSFNDGHRLWSPEIVLLTSGALSVQLIVLGLELKRDIVFFLVGNHEVEILAASATDKGRFARVENQNEHECAGIWMKEGTARLLTSVAGFQTEASKAVSEFDASR